jgi:hypothetical protein
VIRVWFVMPVHGREALTRVCLLQLARTCEAVEEFGVKATAVVIGQGQSLAVAEVFGFGTVRSEGYHLLGHKFNDGYQLACDPNFNPEPADYVVPCGSDNWVDPVIFSRLPDEAIGSFYRIAIVNEEQTQMMRLEVGWKGGAGVRIIPRSFVEATGFRPAAEDRRRAVDTSAIEGIKYALGYFPLIETLDVHPLQIIDWKSHGEQLNSYAMLGGYRRGLSDPNFWEALAEHYPEEALEEMQALRVAVAA